MTLTQTALDPRRIAGDIKRPVREDQPPAQLPLWAIKMRQTYESKLAEKDRYINELESSIMDTKRAERIDENTTALARYGESSDVKALTARLNVLLPYAGSVGTGTVALIAQLAIAHGLDPLPGSDHIYAWKHTNKKTGKEETTVTIGYKGLLHLARKQAHLTYQSAPMTPEQREEHGVKAGETGYITTLYELENAIACKQAGVPYHPIIGTAVWRPGDEIAKGRTPAWHAKKNSMKDALRQITNTGQRMSEVLDQAFKQIGQQIGAQYDDMSYRIEQLPPDVPPDYDAPDPALEGEIIEGEALPFELPSLCTASGCTTPGAVTPVGFLCADHARQKANAEAAKH